MSYSSVFFKNLIKFLYGGKDEFISEVLNSNYKLMPSMPSGDKLLRFLNSATKHVPYYRKHFPRYPNDPQKIFDFLENVEFRVTKNDVRNNVYDFLDERIVNNRVIGKSEGFINNVVGILNSQSLIRVNTGGSTGEPLSFYFTRKTSFGRILRVLATHKYWGWNEGETFLYSGQGGAYADFGMLQTIVKPAGIIIFLPDKLNERSCDRFISLYQKYKPKAMFGFPSQFIGYAHYIQKKGIQLDSSPNHIDVTGEMLSSTEREYLEEIFRTQVYQRYGGTEWGTVGAECRNKNGIHVTENDFFVQNDSEGRLLVTTIAHNDFPLIKYETGDKGKVIYDECECGLKGKKIVNIEGRIEEHFLNSDGDVIAASYFRQLVLLANEKYGNIIIRSQFIVEDRKSVLFLLQLVNKNNQAEIVKLLEENIKSFLKMSVRGEVKDDIRNDRKKFKFLIKI